jgi:hypothetical protein
MDEYPLFMNHRFWHWLPWIVEDVVRCWCILIIDRCSWYFGYSALGPCLSSGGYSTASHAPAWVQSEVESCGICGGQSGTGEGFFQVLLFPLPIVIPSDVSYSSSGAGTNSPIDGRRTKWAQSLRPPLKQKRNTTPEYVFPRCLFSTRSRFWRYTFV